MYLLANHNKFSDPRLPAFKKKFSYFPFSGNLCVEENKRCLVSKDVWSCLKYYFKDCPEFPAHVGPCLHCQVRVAKLVYKWARYIAIP